MPPKCATCSAPFGEHDRVCHYCGTSRGVAESVSKEKAALEELHAAMAKADGCGTGVSGGDTPSVFTRLDGPGSR